MPVNVSNRTIAFKYYNDVYNRHTIYVWNMNYDTIISKESIHKAYVDWYNSSKGKVGKYTESYYENKLKEGNGKPGADCSGMHYKLSGYDATAQGYYDSCTGKGPFNTLPINNLVLLFKGQSSKSIKHTGVYLGNGMCIHMKDSTNNSVYESVDKHNWSAWGYANFIDYTIPWTPDKPVITRYLKMGTKGVDVKLLQTKLNELGYDCGKVDGDFGKKTDKATRTFQAAKKITADGIVGPTTCKKLGMTWKG